MTAEETRVYQHLDDLGIDFERYEHPPVATVEDASAYWAGIQATHCKNLFLRNQKGDRHYLVILPHTRRADLRVVAAQIGDGKLSFASPKRLMHYLGVAPGSVSPFGLIHDERHHVRVFLDRAVQSATRITFHPNVNTVTIVVTLVDLEAFLQYCGNPVAFIDAGDSRVGSCAEV